MKALQEAPMFRTRRQAVLAIAISTGLGVALSALPGSESAGAADKAVYVAIVLPLMRANAEAADRLRRGALLAIEDANARHDIAGYTLVPVAVDDGSSGGDPALVAGVASRLVRDPSVVAIIGPTNTGAARAMAPVLSNAGLAAVTPSVTAPDLLSMASAQGNGPARPNIYFRMVATDLDQGTYMANYFKTVLHVTTVSVLDDTSVYGRGIADLFARQAQNIGIKVVTREVLDPQQIAFQPVLREIKSHNADAFFYGGLVPAARTLMPQAYDMMPKVIKAGSDGIYGPDILKGAGFPAAEGWYVTVPAPHVLDEPMVKPWVARFIARFGVRPTDYSVTAYDAGTVIAGAVKTLVAENEPVDRKSVRDAIARSRTSTLQGVVAFDRSGDVIDPVVSVFQIRRDPSYDADDMIHQFKYLGVAPKAQ
jgi:branched-chain amino acid transport system substrate-binding protein